MAASGASGLDGHFGHGFSGVDVDERCVARDIRARAVGMAARRKRAERTDKQQHAKSEAGFSQAVALQGAQRAGRRQPRREVEPVGGGDPNHGEEQADLEQHQPAVVGRHQVARRPQ